MSNKYFSNGCKEARSRFIDSAKSQELVSRKNEKEIINNKKGD